MESSTCLQRAKLGCSLTAFPTFNVELTIFLLSTVHMGLKFKDTET